MAENTSEKTDDLEENMRRSICNEKKEYYPTEMDESNVKYKKLETPASNQKVNCDENDLSINNVDQNTLAPNEYQMPQNIDDQNVLDPEEYRRVTLELHNENLKPKETLEWIPSTEDFYKKNEEGKEFRRGSRRMSHYLHNIHMTNSSLGLNFNITSEKKDTTLLTESKTVVRFSPIWKQTLASAAPILLLFVSGLTSGYSAILLPELKKESSSIPADESTCSWIAAMAALPMAPGCLVAGWMLETFGRRKSLLMTCLPLLIGWLLITFASTLPVMLVGRFLTGFVAGLLGPLGPIYIGETTDPKYRGFFLAGVSLAIALGILFVHTVGTFISWQWTAGICSVFPILCFLLLILIPESPVWLISKGRTEEGVKSFYWLRGYEEDAKLELKGILDNKKTADSQPKMNFKEKILSLKSPELMKPLVIMILFFITAQFSGVNAIAFYSIEIVQRSVGKSMDHYLVMLIIDSLRFVMSLVACVICRKYGRRPLCFISGICTALSMVGLSMFLYWRVENMSWLPLMCLLFYICSISIGLVPLPWIMCGEVFPTRVRGLGSGISSATTFVAFFIVVKTAPGMMSNLGEVFTFLCYGSIALVGTIIMYFILPETKGKSLQEIEERFKSGKSAGPKV